MAQPDHACLESGDPNLSTSVVQVQSDEDEDGRSLDECLAYVDQLINMGYMVFSELKLSSCECYVWTLN